MGGCPGGHRRRPRTYRRARLGRLLAGTSWAYQHRPARLAHVVDTRLLGVARSQSVYSVRHSSSASMGKSWIVDLGLGNHFDLRNDFHVYCRDEDIERRVRTSGGGFDVLAEMQAAFAAYAKRGKARTLNRKQSSPRRRSARPDPTTTTEAVPSGCTVSGTTRSGKRFRAE
eukprot:COSAG02_NODE_18541_length_933_cov_1.436451_1_plen_171_part_00